MENSAVILTKLEHIQGTVDAMKTKVDDLHDTRIEHGISLKTAHKRIDKMEVKVEAVDDEVKRRKNVERGILAGLSLSAGGVGAFLTSLFKVGG